MPEEPRERGRPTRIQKWNLESLNFNSEGKVVPRPRVAIKDDDAQVNTQAPERSTPSRKPGKDPKHRRKPIGLGDENFRPMVSPMLCSDD